MIIIITLCAFLCGFSLVLAFSPIEWESRPKLQGFEVVNPSSQTKVQFRSIFTYLAIFNRPICGGSIRSNIMKKLSLAHVTMSPEEFILIKEVIFVLAVFIFSPQMNSGNLIFWCIFAAGAAYFLPEFWLSSKIKKIKEVIIKELPDAIDLLALCVNAGLDFMLALKWVVEKSPKSFLIDEFKNLLQEINIGKSRRQAIKDLAKRYELPDLSTFARTLVQADKMGTSVTDALNILSEDMRVSRYRRGETLALKAPLKMLIPLLLFIFPVVAVLVAGPILLDFMQNNPFDSMGVGAK